MENTIQLENTKEQKIPCGGKFFDKKVFGSLKFNYSSQHCTICAADMCIPVFFLISVGNFYPLWHLCVVNLKLCFSFFRLCWTLPSANVVGFGCGVVLLVLDLMCSGWMPPSAVSILCSPSFCSWPIRQILVRNVALIVSSLSFVLWKNPSVGWLSVFLWTLN